jgi:hypothetical protein
MSTPIKWLVLLVLMTKVALANPSLRLSSFVSVRPKSVLLWEEVSASETGRVDTACLLGNGDWLVGRNLDQISGTTLTNVILIERRTPDGRPVWSLTNEFVSTLNSRRVDVTRLLSVDDYFYAVVSENFFGNGTVSLWSGTLDGRPILQGLSGMGRIRGVSTYTNGLAFMLPDQSSSTYSWLDWYSLDALRIAKRTNLKGENLGRLALAAQDGLYFVHDSSVSKSDFEGERLWSRGGWINYKPGVAQWHAISSFTEHQENIILGGYSINAAQGFGNTDATIVWITRDGTLVRERHLGGIGYESAVGVIPTADGGIFVIIETSGSEKTGNKAIDGNGLWLVQLSANGSIEGQSLLEDAELIAVGAIPGEISMLIRKNSNRAHVSNVRLTPEPYVSVQAASSDPFDVEFSDDLGLWKPLAFGLTGEVILNTPANRDFRFYRVRPSVRTP